MTLSSCRVSRLCWAVAAVIPPLAAVLFAVRGFHTRPLEYDEVYTFLMYARKPVTQIFTDLSTPNNHPLHSWLCGQTTLWGDSLAFCGCRHCRWEFCC